MSSLRRKLEAGGDRGCCTRYGAGDTGSAAPREAPGPPGPPAPPLTTVSIRVRVIAAVITVLACGVDRALFGGQRLFVAQSNRNLDALLSGRAQLARQLARSGVGPQQIVNRVDADGCRPSWCCATARYSAAPPAGPRVKSTTQPERTTGSTAPTGPRRRRLPGHGRAADLAPDAVGHGLAALLLSALLVAVAVRFALRPWTRWPPGPERHRGQAGPPPGSHRTDTEIGQTARASTRCSTSWRVPRAAPGRRRSGPGPSWRTPRTSCGRRWPASRRPRRRCCSRRAAEDGGAGAARGPAGRRGAPGRPAGGRSARRRPARCGRRPGPRAGRAGGGSPEVELVGPACSPPGPRAAARRGPARLRRRRQGGGMVRNLLDNASRAAGPAGRVPVRHRGARGGGPRREATPDPGVHRQGPGTDVRAAGPAGQRPSAEPGGSGLGLAIARGRRGRTAATSSAWTRTRGSRGAVPADAACRRSGRNSSRRTASDRRVRVSAPQARVTMWGCVHPLVCSRPTVEEVEAIAWSRFLISTRCLEADPDPFRVRSSFYEQRKLGLVLDCLTKPHYAAAWDPACGSRGVGGTAGAAGEAGAGLRRVAAGGAAGPPPVQHVQERRGETAQPSPRVRPRRTLSDLILVSEFAFYLTDQIRGATLDVLHGVAAEQAELLAVHWRHHPDNGYISGEHVQEEVVAGLEPRGWRHVRTARRPRLHHRRAGAGQPLR